MISGMSSVGSSYLRPTSTFSSNPTLTPGDAQSEAPATADSGTSGPRINVSQLKQLQGAKPISAADDPVLHDLMATNWLTTHSASATQSFVSDDAPQNTYAQVKVDGKVVATLYNGGSATMTNEAGAKVGDLQDPPGLGGPDLARWRADSYAKLLGGTVEKAPTAITQSQWTPHESSSTTYSRDQLDAAFQAMLAEGQKATAQRQSSYLASQAQAGKSTDFSSWGGSLIRRYACRHVGIMGSSNVSIIRDSNMADHDPPYSPPSYPPYELKLATYQVVEGSILDAYSHDRQL